MKNNENNIFFNSVKCFSFCKKFLPFVRAPKKFDTKPGPVISQF